MCKIRLFLGYNIIIIYYYYNNIIINRPSPWWRPNGHGVSWKQVGLTYEESAVKLVVRVLKSLI